MPRGSPLLVWPLSGKGWMSAAPTLTVRRGNDMGLEGLLDNHHYSEGGAYSQLTGGGLVGRSGSSAHLPRGGIKKLTCGG